MEKKRKIPVNYKGEKYESIAECARQTGIPYSTINAYLSKKKKENGGEVRLHRQAINSWGRVR